MTPRGAALALILALLCVVSCEAQGAPRRAGARARAGATGAPRGARGGGARASGRARSSTAAASAASRSYRGRAAPRSTAGIARRRAGIDPNAAGNSGAGRHDARAAPRPGLATRTAPRTFATDGRRARPAVDAAPRRPVARVPATTTTTAATRPRTTHGRPHASTVNALYDANLPETAATETWSVARPTEPEVIMASSDQTEPSDDAVVAVVDVGASPTPQPSSFADEPSEQAAASTDSEASGSEQAAAVTGGDEKTAIGPRTSVNARPA